MQTSVPRCMSIDDERNILKKAIMSNARRGFPCGIIVFWQEVLGENGVRFVSLYWMDGCEYTSGLELGNGCKMLV